MVFSSDGEPAHVGVDVYCALKAVGRLLGVVLLVAVGGVHIVGGRVVLVAAVDVHSRDSAEGLARLVPVLGHLEEVGSAPQHLDPVILFTGPSAEGTFFIHPENIQIVGCSVREMK